MSTNIKTKTLLAGLGLAACGVASLALLLAAPRPPATPGAARPTPLPPAAAPAQDAVFTATRQINGLTVASDGTLWAATAGGVLQRDKAGSWRKFTRLDGLPSHETRRVVIGQEGSATAIFPRAQATWRDGQWEVEPLGKAAAAPPVVWRGVPVAATLSGLRVGSDVKKPLVSLPPSTGTHISALLARGDGKKAPLWAALFGDGIWSFDGQQWTRPNLGLPGQAREITALAAGQEGTAPEVWLGTRRAGVWRYDGQKWTQRLQPDEPYDHNGQALALFRGVLWMSTLEDGLAARTGAGWLHCGSGTISTDAPRQMVEFDGALYVRHGGGQIDRFDGASWTRHVAAALPRGKAMAIAADARRLYVAQWGGWSEWDGQTWTHFLNVPELQGLPLMAIYPDGATLWLGTQSRGVAEITRGPNGISVRWHDERHGLPDDWVTTLARVGATLYAGTFVGGLAWWDGTKWQTAPESKGQNVTALEPDRESGSAGGLFIATRTGVWQRRADGTLERLSKPWLDPEVQALCAGPGGLWVGTRTGLYFVAKPAP